MRLSRHTNPRTKQLKHVQWSNPDMVDEIYEYMPNLHGNHTLCYFINDCRILKQKNPSERSDVRSSKWREQQVRQQPHCCPVTDVFFVCEKTRIQGDNMLKTLVKCMT